MKINFKILPIYIFLAITILPVTAGFIYALLNSFGLAGIFSEGLTTKYWASIFASGELFDSLLYSLILTLIIVFTASILALMLNELVQAKYGLHKISNLFYIPLATPFIVAGFLTYQLLGQSGLFSRIAYALHWINEPAEFPDMVNDSLAIGIIIAHLIIAVSFLTILFANIYKNEKIEELKELASSLGAGKSFIRYKIIFPVILMKAFPSLVLYAIFIFGSYEIPMILGSQDPQMISVTIARKFQRYNIQEIPIAYCMAAVYTFLILLILYILYKNKMLRNETN